MHQIQTFEAIADFGPSNLLVNWFIIVVHCQRAEICLFFLFLIFLIPVISLT